MTEQMHANPDTLVLAPADRLAIARALTADFEAFLAPGERFDVKGEVKPEYLYSQIILRSADQSFQLDLESVTVSREENPSAAELTDHDGLELLFDFLRVQLYEFFRADRSMRFHVDWRAYAFEGYTLRFRVNISSPSLDARADALLAANKVVD